MVAMIAPGSVAAGPPRRGPWRLPASTPAVRVTAGALTSLALALTVATVALHLHTGSTELTTWWYGNAALTLSLAVPGYLIASRKPANPVGWLLVAACLGEALCGAGREYLVFGLLGGRAPGWLWIGWFTDSCYMVAIATVPLLLLLFPDGRPLFRLTGWLVPGTVLAGGLAWCSYLFAGDVTHIRGRELANPAGHLAPAGVAETTLAASMPLLVASLFVAAVALIVRYRRSRGEERRQLAWVVWAGSLLAIEIPTEFVPGNPVSTSTSTAAVVLFGAAVGVAMLRHRLFDIDVIINRTLVYGALSVLVVGAYAVLVVATGSALGRSFSPTHGLVAAVLVAIGFAPARQRLQRTVDRRMYGERRNPYGVVTRLGAQLEGASTRPELAVVVETVAQALRLPHVAIVDPAGQVLATTGTPQGAALAAPLTYQGEALGVLRVEPRSPLDRFGRDEQRLLRDLARQVAAAVHAVQLAVDLQASRRRLVTAKEEERRRLRRDLHDGLGPKLAAVGLRLDRARSLIAAAPDEASDVLHSVKDDIRSTIDDIRRLVYDLRPPALDELGLVGAVRECAARLEPASGPIMTVTAPAALPPLPAAVEVAAYRIVNEALTNVVRHADAGCCQVRIEVDDGQLVVAVDDDGAGVAAASRSGVGTQSMRERAAEIGGRLDITAAPGRGTRLLARLPLSAGHE